MEGTDACQQETCRTAMTVFEGLCEMARRKSKKKRKQRGHYCWRCGRRRANEKFSGKGHAKHICKECVVEQRAEQKRKRQIDEAQRVATNLFLTIDEENYS